MDAVITKEAAIDLSVGDNQIALLASQADGVDLTTKEGYEAGRQILASARTLRVGIETARKELKAFYLETGRKIDAEAKRLKQLVTEIEAPLQASKKAIDDEKARVKREAEEAKQREADAAAKAERERIEKQQREEAAKIEAARAALQAEREKLAAERAEIEAEKERQAKAEADRLQAIEEEKRKREQAEADRLQAIEDEKRAKIEAEEAKKAKAIKKSEDLKAKAEAEAYAIECRQLKTAIVSVDLSAIVLAGREVGISLEGEPSSYMHNGEVHVYDGPDSGRLRAGDMEGSFVVESSEDGSQFEFPAYYNFFLKVRVVLHCRMRRPEATPEGSDERNTVTPPTIRWPLRRLSSVVTAPVLCSGVGQAQR